MIEKPIPNEFDRGDALAISGWKNCLMQNISLLVTEDSFNYLAKKTSAMVEKEQHAMGNLAYMSPFADPDIQDSGG